MTRLSDIAGHVDAAIAEIDGPPPAPTITAATVTPSTLPHGGGNVTINATVTNAVRIEIDRQLATLPAQVAVTVSKSFTITAIGADGTEVLASVHVDVAAADPVPLPGIVPVRGSSIHHKQYDRLYEGGPEAPVDMVDTSRIKPMSPWNVFVDGAPALTIARSMNGVEPASRPWIGQYKRFQVYGGGGHLYASQLRIVDGKVTHVDPNLGIDFDLNIMPRLKTYPLRDGKRGEHILTPYWTVHGHTRRREDGTIATDVNVPMWNALTMDGSMFSLLRDGSARIEHRVFVTPGSHVLDFSYHEPRNEHVYFYADFKPGTLRAADRRSGVSDVHCSGLGGITSCREIPSRGKVYCADNTNGVIYEVDSFAKETKREFCRLPGVFFLDYRSDGKLVALTNNGGGVWVINEDGTRGAFATGIYGSKFMTVSVDRNGTFGKKDACTIVAAQGGAGNVDMWRFYADMTPVNPARPNFPIAYGSGALNAGAIFYCRDALGHYLWVGEHHPDDGCLLVQGMSNTNPALIVAMHPEDTWQAWPYDHGRDGPGFGVLGYPLAPLPGNPIVPSWSTQINESGEGLWSLEQMAEMTFADARAFVRRGGIGSHPRVMTAANEKALIRYGYLHGQDYMRRGRVVIDELETWFKANP